MSDNQPIDLEELTRLYENRRNQRNHDEMANWINAIGDDFPALRDELVTARKNNKDLIQDSCDAQEAAIECAKSFGVCIDNGPGYGEPNIFQLLEDIQKAGETMRDELVRLRQFEKDAREVNNALHREKGEARQAIEKMERQLDEAKGLLEEFCGSYDMQTHFLRKQKANAFLASLAGTTERKPLKLEASKEWFEKSAKIEGGSEVGAGVSPFAQPEQPTQGEVKVLDLERTPGTVFCKPTNPL